MVRHIENEPVFTSPVAFEFFERAFTGPHGEKKETWVVYAGEPPRIRSKAFGNGQVVIARHEPHLRLSIIDPLGEGDWAAYDLLVRRDDTIVPPSELGIGPFPSESVFTKGLEIPPDPDQAKIDDLITLAKKTVSLDK